MDIEAAPVKVKITKGDGTSELRRLAFSFKRQSESDGVDVGFVYHSELCRFLLRSLADLYPDLPVGKFSDLVVFTFKDEDGDMVRYDSEEEFVMAVTHDSWKSCLHVEVTVLEPTPLHKPTINAAPAAPAAPAAADIADIADITPAVGVPSPALEPLPASVDGTHQPATSENGSVMSFLSDMSGSLSASSASLASPASGAAPRSVSSAAPSAASTRLLPPAFGAAATPATAAAQQAPVEESEVMMAATAEAAASSMTADVNMNSETTAAAPPAARSSNSAPAFGDSTAPAKAFLTQVLPSLADVLARSMYAAQWVPNGVPNTVAAASAAAREGANPLGPAAEGLAAAAALVAASAAARVSTTAHSVATSVQAGAETAAAAAGAPPAALAPAAPRTMQPPSAFAAGTPAVAAAPGAAAAAADADTSRASPAVHSGVQCDVCDQLPIIGTRYKCAVRTDFDLCEDCERSPAGRDSPFPFLKIRTSNQAPAAIVCLLKPDQPGSAQEAAAAVGTRDNGNGNPCGGNRNKTNGPSPRSYAPGHAWRGRSSNPQHGGWGEGRRNGNRWMKDLARRQQQQFERAAAGIYAPGLEFVRGPAGCNRPPWCGPRMTRRHRDDAAPAAAQNKTQETAAASQPPTPPAASVPTSDANDIVTASFAEVAPVVDNDDAAAAAAEKQPAAETATAVDSGASALTASALEQQQQACQSEEYHNLLAASMRSLANSMTSSFSAAAPQDGSRASKAHGAAVTESKKPQGKPMARFVTDVSVADGSPLPPNTRFVKTWCMRNDGSVTFPAGCRMMPVGGDLMDGPEDGVTVEQRAPGEEFHVSVPLTTPSLSGRYIGYWRLRTAEGQNFGHRVWADVLVTGGTASLIDEGTLDGDWDLVNMQRLSKAIEDTGKDNASAAGSRMTVEPAASGEPPASGCASGEVGSLENLAASISATFPRPPSRPGGFEESKSSEEAQVVGDKAPEAAAPPAQVMSPPSVPATPAAVAPGMATKWHRELCSLAEMGFENTPRNVQLLEKHVVKSGEPGMERVLHELLSWREVSIQ